jgi:uncharacterized repeat protein (TIGR03803 family)
MITAVLTTAALATAQIYTETVLHDFAGPRHGATPYAELIRDPAGNLYGTTYSGGEWGYGVVFGLDSAGKETVLHSFAGGLTDGAYPITGLVRDSQGTLYGTTTHGGANGLGIVFRIDTHAHETILYNFTGAEGQSCAPLILDSAGNLYGTTQAAAAGPICGGYLGTVFKVDRRGHFSVLYSFTGGADGGVPAGRLVRDSSGNLYGTTAFGGTSNQGVVFKLDPAGMESVVYSFTGGADGAMPQGNLVRDSAGNLYGTAYSGGAYGFGVVFKVDARGNEAALYSFTGTGLDGGDPASGVIRDPTGSFYGATSSSVFKLDTRDDLAVLHTFLAGTGGTGPLSGLVLDSVGNLYGTAAGGGTPNFANGVVYKLDPTGAETVLYSFPVAPDGSTPNPGLVHDSAGNLYGTTARGGSYDAGSVFRIDASGHEAVLYSFTGGTDGANPAAGLVRDPTGNFYGTTSSGGGSGLGVVFKLDAHGNETVLHSFGGPDGANPAARLAFDSAGNLYGTTVSGGVNGPMGFPGGVVFKLDKGGNLKVLHAFSGADGLNPFGGVVLDPEGNVYGTTVSGGVAGSGVVFKINPSQVETVLFNFTSGATGIFPSASLVRDPEGNLYGTAGVVFKIDPTGNETVLYSFTEVSTGAFGGLAHDRAGNLYGTANGGSSGLGFVFKLDPAGNLTVLHNFTGGADGNSPSGGVILDGAGDIYGPTLYGGLQNGGVVFKLTP